MRTGYYDAAKVLEAQISKAFILARALGEDKGGVSPIVFFENPTASHPRKILFMHTCETVRILYTVLHHNLSTDCKVFL